MGSSDKNFLIILGIIVLISIGLVVATRRDQTSPSQEASSLPPVQAPQTTQSNLKEQPKEEQAMYKTYSTPPEMQLKKGVNYKAVLKTQKGDIVVDLFQDKTPVTVNNFVFLAKEGFYDGTKFHRIMKDFMIQGGDPLGNGMGGPGYKFADETFEGNYERGTVAMANSGPNTNGSQFFIMHKDYPLPPNYVIFGKVSDENSLKVVDALANSAVTTSFTGEKSQPIEDQIVDSVEILEE